MTRKNILTWTLVWTLAALLLVAWVALAEAGPRTREPAAVVPGLTPTEQYCRSLGIFAWRRANERQLGYAYTDVLSLTRRFVADNNLDDTTAHWHEAIVRAIYGGTPVPPVVTRQSTEDACMEWARELQVKQAAPRTATPDARLRY
jgi:hypothetical protein